MTDETISSSTPGTDAVAQIELKKSKYKPIDVDRITPPTFDLGHLAIFDSNPVSDNLSGNALEIYLTRIARDSAQILYNAIFSQETVSQPDGIYVQLPIPKTQLPRGKPVPKQQAQTKWAKFAQEKGIVNRKRSRKEYDEDTGTYRPRYGYGSKKNEKAWLIPVNSRADPYADPYALDKSEKQARIAKNAKQQMQNQQQGKRELLDRAVMMTKKATASVGKFDKPLQGDSRLNQGTKRQFQPTAVRDLSGEKSAAATIADRIVKKKHEAQSSSIHANRAVGIIERQQRQGPGAGKKREFNPKKGGQKKSRDQQRAPKRAKK